MFEPGKEAEAKKHEKHLARTKRISEVLLQECAFPLDKLTQKEWDAFCIRISQNRELIRKAIRENK